MRMRGCAAIAFVTACRVWCMLCEHCTWTASTQFMCTRHGTRSHSVRSVLNEIISFWNVYFHLVLISRSESGHALIQPVAGHTWCPPPHIRLSPFHTLPKTAVCNATIKPNILCEEWIRWCCRANVIFWIVDCTSHNVCFVLFSSMHLHDRRMKPTFTRTN